MAARQNEPDSSYWVRRAAKTNFVLSLVSIVLGILSVLVILVGVFLYIGGLEEWRKEVDDNKDNAPVSILERMTSFEGDLSAIRKEMGNFRLDLNRLLDRMLGMRPHRRPLILEDDSAPLFDQSQQHPE